MTEDGLIKVVKVCKSNIESYLKETLLPPYTHIPYVHHFFVFWSPQSNHQVTIQNVHLISLRSEIIKRQQMGE